MRSNSESLFTYGRWREALHPIRQELYFLAISREVFSKFENTLSANKRLQRLSEHLFINWIVHNYAVRIGMSIRRITSEHNSTKSNLRHLLKQIKKKPGVVSVENMVRSRMHDRPIPQPPSGASVESIRQEAERIFSETINREGAKELTAEQVGDDIERINELSKRIIRYASAVFAHMGKFDVSEDIPKINEAHECIDVLITVFDKYSRLLNAPTEFTIPDDNVLFCDWQKLFSFPWITTKGK